MAITKQQIVDVLNARLARSETLTTLAEEIRSVLVDLSSLAQWPDLHTSADVELEAGDEEIAVPDGLVWLQTIVPSDPEQSYRPLTIIGKAEMDILRAGPGLYQGPPRRYCRVGVTFQIYPTCDKAYTATLGYWQRHPDQATILFGEDFREAIYNGVMGKYLEGKGLFVDPKRQEILQSYGREIAKLLALAETGIPMVTCYRG